MSGAGGASGLGSPTGLIALDWGTSTLRAWRLSRAGTVLEARQRDWGIMHLPDGGFPGAFEGITRGWSEPGRQPPAIACGMVGSRQGWLEVPYLPTPAGLPQLAGGLATLPCGDVLLHLVPGVLQASDREAPDVMRGEETQAMGAVPQLGGDALLVMPGTHSKWTRLQDGRLVSFRTMMTGELFALLCRHSILGRGLAEAAPSSAAVRQEAFARGVAAAHAHGAFARLFSVRALALTGGLEAGCVADYLSGLLIGEELRLAGTTLSEAARIAITGDAALCERYARAFAVIGAEPPEAIPDTALDGLVRIAVRAGLIPAASEGPGRSAGSASSEGHV